ncbi:hypothetical protein RDWZM_004260 [Blomia tropicalis]|uniref:UDP-glycosyltransferase n=1 Tax=Blomia tropicalis TaxID=40697 RepID=A0A9Q0RTG5_BLOTA|nr:hypothetical protein RDWZM_004260 [Blomia tropicalis]
MEKLTILVTPINAVGHVNAVSGALAPMVRRGHRVIMVIEEAFEGKLAKLGFEEFVYRMVKCKDEENPGYPSDGKLIDKYEEFYQIKKSMFYSEKGNKLIESLGYKRYENGYLLPQKQTLTVYAYPNEINYPYIAQKDWFNLEVFNKHINEPEKPLNKIVPIEFFNNTLDGKWSGKWIYLSMGSMGSIDLNLMQRLCDILKDTNHKYIVSKGPRHEEYDLPANMYGERYLPQISIIQHVDLVIGHGGNNTVTEVFAVGKPMIILPIFVDQFDNAQRLHETGYGIRLDVTKFTSKELIDAIETILNDHEMTVKYKIASKRIQMENRHEELANKLESMFGFEAK